MLPVSYTHLDVYKRQVCLSLPLVLSTKHLCQSPVDLCMIFYIDHIPPLTYSSIVRPAASVHSQLESPLYCTVNQIIYTVKVHHSVLVI